MPEDDLTRALYDRLGVPVPTISREESERLRFSFRNERTYYHRTCDLTGRELISIYAPDSPHKVYHHDVWFSDRYNPLEHGRDFDFTKPFFEQFRELMLAVPFEHMIVINSDNCDYANFVVDARNVYLSVRVATSEDISYSYLVMESRDSIDCFNMNGCELCYECVDSLTCHTCRWCQRCKQCNDCSFCIDCIGCNHCFGCIGLRHQEYHFFGEKLSKGDYERKLQEFPTTSHRIVQENALKILKANHQKPQRFAMIEASEDVTGDYIINSRRVRDSFDVESSEDVIGSTSVEYGKDVARSCFAYHPELIYELISCTPTQNARFCYGVYDSHDVEYCVMVYTGSHDCYGCVGLKKNSYCILNKQYTEEEFKRLRDKIIDHMKKSGEYGRFFPPLISQFAYNESTAQEYYPLTKEQAVKLGYRWKESTDQVSGVTKVIPAGQLPDALDDVPDDVLHWAIQCEKTGRPFKLVKQELDFYREQRIPIPHLHPDERHLQRVNLRNPRKLWTRKCGKCGKDMHTSYASDCPEVVYCEECYLKEVY